MKVSHADRFSDRHIGPNERDVRVMLKAVGAGSLEALIDEAVPSDIRLASVLQVRGPETEAEFLTRLRRVGRRNRPSRALIGLGYYGCITPSVILRNVFENPGWYTPYTPYQAEVAQGRLEALFNFQTMVADLTGMPVANASLLDEATAAAEAMSMMYRLQARTSSRSNRLLVSDACFPQTIEVVGGRAAPLGIEVEVGDPEAMTLDGKVFGLLLQYPGADGSITPIAELVAQAHQAGALVAVCTDLLALTLLTPPGDLGADVVVGSSQRFGVPMGYGGPHAAFFATRESSVRQTPGRIIGLSVDRHGEPAYRMSLQTREQHIRRERATSNICTAQALLANIAGFYAVYHGPVGLRGIAERVHGLTRVLAEGFTALGLECEHQDFFDTLSLRLPVGMSDRLHDLAVEAGLLFRYVDEVRLGISLDETTTVSDVDEILSVAAGAMERKTPTVDFDSVESSPAWPAPLVRQSEFLTHPVFHRYRSETEMMRYLKRLERRDIGLDTSMIPLGSCTMKLTAASAMRPVSWPEYADLHPFAPKDLAGGYQEVFDEFEASLCAITGLPAVSLQPNSGAQGEFAGLMVIRAYQRDQDQARRDVVLIPASAHGTNPASAAMAGMRVVIVRCDDDGNIDLGDLRSKAEIHHDVLCALMVTYPSTHGVFEDAIREICRVVHTNGGQVYMDGANMNAQVGLTSPALIGADVCHINLHKTFSIPHGGGGPGMGPIAVAAHLAPYLPGHPVVQVGGARAISAIAAAPWGSASILLISHGYMSMLGPAGMQRATAMAILNANYLKAQLESQYAVLYTRANGRVAHELIFDLRAFEPYGITELDIAKRLMDYGFHAPTVSFPVSGTMMVEPTESEGIEELDRFCAALRAIRDEIQAVIDGRADPVDNVLKNAPHTALEAITDDWSHSYSREQAVYPVAFVRANKVWPSVGRIDNAHGDRNLICSCPPVETYQN
ncbi:MAG: aminomethyl-transferring glycine dehydrogenase [Acidobacteriota bacterium]|nr:aminomethyl-transferring glycine dehydrogenase [Acidobacteriota bacterium]